MQNVVNKEIDKWEHPWNKTKFDDINDRDERFFSLVTKGVLAYLNTNMMMYNKPIRHYILNTSSTMLYVESNGYEYSLKETSGEDWMYQERPRCQITMSSVSVPTEELSSSAIRGTYERRSSIDGQIYGYNAEIRRLPMELKYSLKYIFSNYNEALIFLQEAYDHLMFQIYFNIVYLGQNIRSSIELPNDSTIELTPLDMGGSDKNTVTISFDINVNTNYPKIDERTESRNDKGIIASFNHDTDSLHNGVPTGGDRGRVIDPKDSYVYRPTVSGYYNKFTKSFYEDEESKTKITPDEIHVYIDTTSGRKFYWSYNNEYREIFG